MARSFLKCSFLVMGISMCIPVLSALAAGPSIQGGSPVSMGVPSRAPSKPSIPERKIATPAPKPVELWKSAECKALRSKIEAAIDNLQNRLPKLSKAVASSEADKITSMTNGEHLKVCGDTRGRTEPEFVSLRNKAIKLQDELQKRGIR